MRQHQANGDLREWHASRQSMSGGEAKQASTRGNRFGSYAGKSESDAIAELERALRKSQLAERKSQIAHNECRMQLFVEKASVLAAFGDRGGSVSLWLLELVLFAALRCVLPQKADGADQQNS